MRQCCTFLLPGLLNGRYATTFVAFRYTPFHLSDIEFPTSASFTLYRPHDCSLRPTFFNISLFIPLRITNHDTT